MWHSCLLGDAYKFDANAGDNDQKITKIHHFVASIKYSNVIFNIRMLQHLKVRSNVEHSFMH